MKAAMKLQKPLIGKLLWSKMRRYCAAERKNLRLYWSVLLSRKGIYEWKEPKHHRSPPATTASAIELQDWGWGVDEAEGWWRRRRRWAENHRGRTSGQLLRAASVFICACIKICEETDGAKELWRKRWVISGKVWKRQKMRARMRHIKTKNNRKWKEKELARMEKGIEHENKRGSEERWEKGIGKGENGEKWEGERKWKWKTVGNNAKSKGNKNNGNETLEKQ